MSASTELHVIISRFHASIREKDVEGTELRIRKKKEKKAFRGPGTDGVDTSNSTRFQFVPPPLTDPTYHRWG